MKCKTKGVGKGSLWPGSQFLIGIEMIDRGELSALKGDMLQETNWKRGKEITGKVNMRGGCEWGQEGFKAGVDSEQRKR